jgi:hypothetical protein
MRIKKIIAWAAIPIGLLASGLLVLGFSNAAFTAQTSNANNSWSTGTVSLNNTLTLPMFNYQTNTSKGSVDPLMYPNKSLSNTIKVNYVGTNPVDVHLYANLGTDSGSLAQNLNVTIHDDTANSTVYTGTLANLASTNHDFASGLGGWSPTANASETYTFTVTAGANVPQGATLGGSTFTWEANTPAS